MARRLVELLFEMPVDFSRDTLVAILRGVHPVDEAGLAHADKRTANIDGAPVGHAFANDLVKRS